MELIVIDQKSETVTTIFLPKSLTILDELLPLFFQEFFLKEQNLIKKRRRQSILSKKISSLSTVGDATYSLKN
jgi:hypothetical protein